MHYNYKNMNLAEIENLATQACFATDYQIKSQAEQSFFTLCQKIGPAQLSQLMDNGSQTLLFVLMEYLHKVLPDFKAHYKQVLSALIQTIEKWYNTNATLIRADGKSLENYVEKSVSRTLGQTLKFLYSNTEDRDYCKKSIEQIVNPNFKLFVWKTFIQTVANIDSHFTFLTYRSIVYHFQENIIPIIMDSLLPYFQSVEDTMKINQLAQMHEKMAVSERPNNNNGQKLHLFQAGEVKFTTLVFNLLKEVVCFNYNITYSEYESEVPIDNCLVAYPDSVTKKVTNPQFVASIIYIIQKLMLNDLKSPFLKISLDCLQKIVLVKMFYISTDIKKQFTKAILQGLIKLLKIQNLNEEILQNLIESNCKLLVNIELYHLREFGDDFNVWIQLIKSIFAKVVNYTAITFDNSLFNQSLELVLQIVQESIAPQLRDDFQHFKDFAADTSILFFRAFFEKEDSVCLIGNNANKLKSYDDLRKTSQAFFRRIKNLCCVNLEKTLNYLLPTISIILTGSDENKIANIYFLFAQLYDTIILDRNILYEAQPEQTYPILGQILFICLEWIEKYRSFNKSIEIIDIGILFFVEKIISECLGNFRYENQALKINCKIYRFIEMVNPSVKEEPFLTFGFSELANNLVNGDVHRVSYTFDIISSLLLKFKWGSKRQNFKQTTIAKNVLDLCQSLTQKNFEGEMLQLRRNLFKIIASINFDDILDDYRKNITELVDRLAMSMKQNRWKVLYDLSGICEAIDTVTIYRYFLTCLEKKMPIDMVMKEFFDNCENNIEIVKIILELQLIMIGNKGQRLSGSKNTFYNYRLISHLMPYWDLILQNQKCGSDDWDQILLLLYKIFKSIFRDNACNYYLLDKNIPSAKTYLLNMLQNMVTVQKWIQMYPQLFDEYRANLKTLSQNFMEVIFCNPDPAFPYTFNQILAVGLKLTLKQIECYKNGNKKSEDYLQCYFQFCKNVFRYLRKARFLKHKQIQLNNMSILGQDNMEVKFDFIIGLIKFGISLGKSNFTLLESICIILHNMDFLFTSAIQLIIQNIGLDPSKSHQLREIWDKSISPQSQDQIQNQIFISEMRDWFKKCDTEALPDVNQY